MGFFFRKSLNFGPFRLNFSKSGVGASVGVKGARLSSGPRGTYINFGSNGFYYRQRIDTSTKERAKSANTVFGSSLNEPSLEQESIITDLTSKELLDEINARIQRQVPTNLVTAVCLFIIFLALCLLIGAIYSNSTHGNPGDPIVTLLIRQVLPVSVLILGSLVCIRYYRQYHNDRTSELSYELQGVAQRRYAAITNACEVLSKSASIWRLATFANDVNQPLDVLKEQPPFIKTNVEVWSLDSNRMSVYFLPDYAFIWLNKSYAAVSYESLIVSFSTNSYYSPGAPPADATILDYRFQHTRKDGGRDLRYKHNPAIPLIQYGLILITSKQGLKLRLQVSNVNAAKMFADIFSQAVTGQNSSNTKGDTASNSRKSSSAHSDKESSRDSRRHQETRSSYKRTANAEVMAAYATLEVRIGASRDEILSAYRELAKSYHPDKVVQQSARIARLAEEKMKEINQAIETLKRHQII